MHEQNAGKFKMVVDGKITMLPHFYYLDNLAPVFNTETNQSPTLTHKELVFLVGFCIWLYREAKITPHDGNTHTMEAYLGRDPVLIRTGTWITKKSESDEKLAKIFLQVEVAGTNSRSYLATKEGLMLVHKIPSEYDKDDVYRNGKAKDIYEHFKKDLTVIPMQTKR